jgi:hypothetical protein
LLGIGGYWIDDALKDLAKERAAVVVVVGH